MSESLLHLRPGPRRGQRLALTCGVGLLVLAGLGGWTWSWVHSYEGRIAPHVRIGPVSVGGLSPDTARLLLHKQADDLFARGAPVTLNGGRPATLTLAALVDGDFIEDARADVDGAVDQAARIGHTSNPLQNAVDMLRALARTKNIPLPVTLREDALRASLARLYPDAERPTTNARLSFHKAGGIWTAKIIDGIPGTSFDVPRVLADVEQRLSTLSSAPIDVRLSVVEPLADRRIAELAIPPALAALRAAPYSFIYTADGNPKTFDVSDVLLAQSLEPATDGSLLLKEAPIRTALESFAAAFEIKAENARFSVIDGRVTQFIPSRTGVTADTDAALALVQQFVAHADQLRPDEKIVRLPATIIQPDVPTEGANDLGIVAVLGVGVSSYAPSSPNRLKNIQNGVKLLNGLLIPPGETFSALTTLGPFTPENGYVPELVIKGDSIELALGGGLCQIGTTAFRAAMNSGLPIKERSNHSLVISHYNDMINGNPGTDATLFSPAPDLKFVNNTGKYILFEAHDDPKTQQVRFTLWGTPDGRHGSYTSPEVVRWIPAGEPREIISPDLKPGEKKCQNPFRGADTTFNYTVAQADGTSVTRTFTSHYRPLPKICLVGANPSVITSAPLSTSGF